MQIKYLGEKKRNGLYPLVRVGKVDLPIIDGFVDLDEDDAHALVATGNFSYVEECSDPLPGNGAMPGDPELPTTQPPLVPPTMTAVPTGRPAVETQKRTRKAKPAPAKRTRRTRAEMSASQPG